MRAPSAYPMGGAQEMVAKNIRAEGKKMKKRHRLNAPSASGSVSEGFVVLTRFAFTTTLRGGHHDEPHSLMRKTRHREVK